MRFLAARPRPLVVWVASTIAAGTAGAAATAATAAGAAADVDVIAPAVADQARATAGGPIVEVPLLVRRPRALSAQSFRRRPRAGPEQHVLSGLLAALARCFAPEPLEDVQGVEYIAAVEVGTPGQLVKVILDTGSSDLWIASSHFTAALSGTVYCLGHGVTDNSWSGCGRSADIHYGVGSVQGDLLVDRLRLGSCSLKSQGFLLATSVSNLDLSYFDGVLGLAFPALSNTRTATVLEQLGAQAGVSVFSFHITGEGDVSTFGLGMPRESWYMPGTLVYSPVPVEGWWTFEGALAVGSAILLDNSLFALDTGTSYLTLPLSVLHTFLEALLGSEQLQQCTFEHNVVRCPCSLKDTANITYVAFVGRMFPIFPEDLFTESFDISACIVEVQVSNNNLPLILGDTFLRTVLPVFDAGVPRVGLGLRADHVPQLPSTRERLRRDSALPRTGPFAASALPAHAVGNPMVGVWHRLGCWSPRGLSDWEAHCSNVG